MCFRIMAPLDLQVASRLAACQMAALISVLALLHILLCGVAAVGLGSVCKRNSRNSRVSKGSPREKTQLKSCIRGISCDECEAAISARLATHCNTKGAGGVARFRLSLELQRTDHRQTQWAPNVRTWFTRTFLIVRSPLITEVAVGEGASCHSLVRGLATTTTYRSARGTDRGRMKTAPLQNRRRLEYAWTLPERPRVCTGHDSVQQAESHYVKAAELPVGVGYIPNMKYTWHRCRIKGTLETSRVSFSLCTRSALSKLIFYRRPIIPASDVPDRRDQAVHDLHNTAPSLLTPLSGKRKAATLQASNHTVKERPKTPVPKEGDVTCEWRCPATRETDTFSRPGEPVDTPSLPPTRASQILLNPSLLCSAERTEDSHTTLGEDELAEHVQQQELSQQRGIGPKGNMKGNGLHEDRLGGPLSMYERRDNIALAVNMEGPQDVYVLDFDTVIQPNLREVTNTGFHAWQHLERENISPDKADGGSPDRSTASSLIDHNFRKGTKVDGRDKLPVAKSHSETSLRHPPSAVSGHRFSEIFSRQRFSQMECPAWLVARMRDARKSLALRGSPDFMVAMRRIVELMMAVEEGRGSTIDFFVERNEKFFQEMWKTMDPAEKVWLVTKNGNFFDTRDIFKFRRGAADVTGTRNGSGYPWIVRMLQGWETTGERAALYKRYNTTEAELQQAFDYARGAWKVDNEESWNESVKYRSSLPRMDSRDADRREIYEGFNAAAIWCLNNHINNWRRPLHIVSIWETSAEVLSMLRVLGLSAADEEATRLLHIYGRDTLEHLVATEMEQPAKRQREDAASGTARGDEGWNLTPPAFREEEEAASLKRCVVSYIVRGWRAGKYAWRPVHIIDGNIRSLLALRDSPQLRDLRLYFCEWGHSTVEDKAVAFLASRIKYMKHSMQLVKVMSTPANIPARQWTHGYTSCPPEWMEDYKVRRWVRWCGFTGEEDTVLQDISMLEQPEN